MQPREVWITGRGLISALGEGSEAHWAALSEPARWRATIDEKSFAPFPVHPIAPLDLDRFIPKKGDQRAMGPLMHYAVAATGLALREAGVAGDAALLAHTDLVVAGPGGERDLAVDEQILAGIETAANQGAYLNEHLLNDLRPTLFLAQLPNLIAGNISIVHGVTGSSRTFMGEEIAGIDALRDGFARVRSGQSELALVGATFNASRWDQMLLYRPGGLMLDGPWQPLWHRPRAGIALGSLGAALVLEAPEHAQARGRRPLAKLTAAMGDRSRRTPGAAAAAAQVQWEAISPRLARGHAGLLSGCCGSGPLAAEERDLLAQWGRAMGGLPVRAAAGAWGHAMEASFLGNLALAITCLEQGGLFPPLDPDEPLEAPWNGAALQQVLVTGWGHHRGEGLALVEAA
ncbi:beta-ketoacyl-ACP synthase II [Hypericibacter adhaerens]|uniref:Beta-ketoacyl-ACP synthase II n=1 Tax=Hypericibacter adhaerens TaxID=2602016 RepID=A0A5J6MVL8_9PROT|nr:beta-ketoacyl-ACP synthase [Hypericibacter adhaerens]QEX21341.1 beta-ketoacyl-ACP synthase II [Hypericibacter adhaerens]